MEYRTLGSAGCAVSTLALGAMTFGSESNESASRALLDHFTDAGGTLIDTADTYGHGTSEEIIGRWLTNKGGTTRDRVVLATKRGSQPGGDPTMSGSPADISLPPSKPHSCGCKPKPWIFTRCMPGTR
jgi:aryl-alcohol dehydrogenase-like predicted oxidoreductase